MYRYLCVILYNSELFIFLLDFQKEYVERRKKNKEIHCERLDFKWPLTLLKHEYYSSYLLDH